MVAAVVGLLEVEEEQMNLEEVVEPQVLGEEEAGMEIGQLGGP